jgi:hypothetical protein
MRFTKIVFAAIIVIALALPAMAQNNPPQGGGAQGSQEAVKTKTLKADTFMKQVDKNGDGKITKEEWLAAGISERGFMVMDSVGTNGAGGFTPKKLGYVTKEIIESFTFKADVDSNNDGKLTLEKLLAFEKAPAGQAPSGGQGGQPPASGQGGQQPAK